MHDIIKCNRIDKTPEELSRFMRGGRFVSAQHAPSYNVVLDVPRAVEIASRALLSVSSLARHSPS